jgi:hypothetical protein
VLSPIAAIIAAAAQYLPVWASYTVIAAVVTVLILGGWIVAVRCQRMIAMQIADVSNETISFSIQRRRAAKELVMYLVGDEAAGVLMATFVVQWLVRLISNKASLVGVVGLCLAFELFRRLSVAAVGRGLVLALAIYLIAWMCSLLTAALSFGVEQAVGAIDSAIAVSPGPLGAVELRTIWWMPRDSFRHSGAHSTSRAIRELVDWTALTVEHWDHYVKTTNIFRDGDPVL